MLSVNSSHCFLRPVHDALVSQAYALNSTLLHAHTPFESPTSSTTLVTGLVLIALGAVVLFLGNKIARPFLCGLCALVGALIAQAVLFDIPRLAVHVPCWSGGVLLALFAVAGALLGAFLLNAAFFLTGCVLGLALVQVFFNLFPQLDINVGGLSRVSGHGIVPFWTVAIVAALVLGFLLLKKQHELLAIITAFLGACAIDSGIVMTLASQHAHKWPSPAHAGIVVGLFVVGVAAQLYRERKERRSNPLYVAYCDERANQPLVQP